MFEVKYNQMLNIKIVFPKIIDNLEVISVLEFFNARILKIIIYMFDAIEHLFDIILPWCGIINQLIPMTDQTEFPLEDY